LPLIRGDSGNIHQSEASRARAYHFAAAQLRRRENILKKALDLLLYFFFGADPAGCPVLENPAAVVGAGAAFTLSFFGFFASLLLRICPLAIFALP